MRSALGGAQLDQIGERRLSFEEAGQIHQDTGLLVKAGRLKLTPPFGAGGLAAGCHLGEGAVERAAVMQHASPTEAC